MRLKTFLGLCIGLISVFVFSAITYASPSFELATPIDVDTMEEITSYETDNIIAVPVHIYTDDDDVISNFGISIVYDTDLLTPTGISASTYSKLGSAATNTGFTSRSAYGFYCIADSEVDFGTASYVKDETAGVVYLQAITIATSLSASDNGSLVGYFIFKITGSVSDDELNGEIFDVNPNSDGTAIKLASESSMIALTGTFTKTNACAGAMNVVVNTSALDGITGTIQTVYVKTATGTDITELKYYSVDSTDTVYTFPVRVTGDSLGESTKVEVYITTDTESDVLVASYDLDTTGTITSYESVSADNPTTAD